MAENMARYDYFFILYLFLFYFILFIIIIFFWQGAACRYSHFPAHGCLGESFPLQDKTSPELWVLGPWNNPENKTDKI